VDRHQKVSPATVFYVYAREDEPLRDELSKHMSNLVRQGLIKEWYDQQILAGTDKTSTIDKHFQDASVILLLVSPDFLASDYCYSVEMQRALERHHAGNACVIPLILRPVDWRGIPLADLQYLPRDAKPVTTWTNRDAAFLDIVDGIRNIIENMNTLAVQTPSVPLPSVWNIPYPRNLFFTGREDLFVSLVSSLQVDQIAALTQVQAISGLRGVGKTQIAVEYAYRYHSFYQAVFWAQAETYESLVSSFVTIAQLLNLPGKNARDQALVVKAVIEWMQTHTAWLLILDNSDDLGMAKAFIPPVFGGHPPDNTGTSYGPTGTPY